MTKEREGLDIDAEPELAARFGIESIPTVAVFDDGEAVTGFVGAQPPAAIGRFLDAVVHDDIGRVAGS